MIATVRLWLDHPQVGCGWRYYAVARMGRKWVRLVALASGESFAISRADYERARPQPAAFTARKTAQRLRRNAKVYGCDGSTSVKAALENLREVQHAND